MTVTIANHTFEHAQYDAVGDVLYLKTRVPDGAVDFEDTPEGHSLRFGASGEIVGITLLSPRWLLQQHGKVEITLPQHVDVDAAQLDEALLAA